MKACFAAGCFWGVQFYFDQVPGVYKTIVGYTGGTKHNPTYEEVCSHTTGHAEAVEIEFDEAKITYEKLVTHFFRMHDPTQLNRQGTDVGDSYRSAIFYYTDSQKQTAERLKQQLATRFDAPIVTQISAVGTFYVAEDYHQKFTERTGRGMCHIPYKEIV